MDISVVIPLYNEEESLVELHDWVRRVMLENKLSYEIIFVDDGSSDGSWEIIKGLKNKYDTVRAIKFRRVMWSSQWMPIFKIARMKSRNFIV